MLPLANALYNFTLHSLNSIFASKPIELIFIEHVLLFKKFSKVEAFEVM